MLLSAATGPHGALAERSVPSSGSRAGLPNFLIVGAAKAGTTSLHAWLRQHPDVFLPDHKEPTHFCHSGVRLFDPDRYRDLFDPGKGRRAVGEASTAYLASPESPALIRAALGRIKIVVVLRDPVARSVSLYNWMVMEGFEPLPTLERALKAERRRFRNPWFRDKNPEYFWNYMYFRSGLYAGQLARYYRAFGRESVGVWLFEDLVEEPERLYREVCRFLGVSADFSPVLQPENHGRRPRSVRLQFALKAAERAAEIHLPGRHRRRVIRWLAGPKALNVRLGRRERGRPETLRGLRARYREDIRRTARLTGRDLGAWLER